MSTLTASSPATREQTLADQRIQRLQSRLKVDKYPICVEKVGLVIASFRRSEGEPEVLRRARAIANYLDHRTIFIEDDELIVGNVASRPMGMEAGCQGPTWPPEELAEMTRGEFAISEAEVAELRSYDEYWRGQGRTFYERMALSYGDERMWPFIQSGILLPPWKQKWEGRGHGAAGAGWGLGIGLSLNVVDFARVLNGGLNQLIAEAEEELRNLRYTSADAVKKDHFLQAVIIANRAIVRTAHRFADLAMEMAGWETDPGRRRELERIAETCRWVPGNPARTFPEALQAFWFIWVMIGGGTTAGGRFDQFMYPFYRRDRDEGRITDEEVLELLQCLRVKVMQLNGISGSKAQREKWSGLARWNNWVIGGVTPEGEDATNELSYLVLEAARRCQTPHYTITVRVHDGTPDALMLKALEVVKTGLGLPAFVGDKSYLEYLEGEGVPLAEARDYALGGCLDAQLPGRSRTNAIGMFVVPLVFEIAMRGGIEPRTGRQLGPRTGELATFANFDDLLGAFKTQLAHFMALASEEHNISLMAQAEVTPDPIHSSLMADAVTVGRDALDRVMPFENGSVLNPVGMINVADSLAAIKKLVFDEQKVTARELQDALAANWEGYEDLRKLCLAAPKYGNGEEYVDAIARDLYQFWADTAHSFTSVYGARVKVSGISITSYGPGGELTGATPDGRLAGENLADGTVSPAQGKDIHGPTALLRSAMVLDQGPYQSNLLNIKFHPSALQTEEDLLKLSHLIRAYFACGGKHVQFNVVNRETLLDAQRHPERHRDLIVRVAGYSAYFVQLSKRVQDDIIGRLEHEVMA